MSPDKRDRSPPPEPTPSQIDAQVGQRLRYRREDVGLSRVELATILGIDESDLEAIEGGRTRAGPKLVDAAADALGVSVHWFFSKW
jgi:transcriptional regulator with XRE-family HTH domain